MYVGPSQTSLRDYDHVARVGGDESLCVLPATALADAETVAERPLGEVAARCAGAFVEEGYASDEV